MVSPGDEEFCFPISTAEMAAIRATDPDRGECFAHAPNTPGFVDQLALLMPGHEVRSAFPLQGSHWRLAVTSDGACVFLGREGCVLDRAVRPLYCRLFPLWSFEGQLTWFTAEECLANRQCSSLSAMLEAMGTDAAEVRDLFAAMCANLGLKER
jgi:hypothetical protein